MKHKEKKQKDYKKKQSKKNIKRYKDDALEQSIKRTTDYISFLEEVNQERNCFEDFEL